MKKISTHGKGIAEQCAAKHMPQPPLKHLLIDVGYNLSQSTSPAPNKCWPFRRNIWVSMVHALVFGKYLAANKTLLQQDPNNTMVEAGALAIFGLN